jgi:hypothetical protein
MAGDLLTVVEEVKNLSFSDFIDNIYDAEFWIPFVPLRDRKIENITNKNFKFEVGDILKMDPMGLLKIDFAANGTIKIVHHEDNGAKGQLWDLVLDVEHPKSYVTVRVRAREIGSNLKIGIFLKELTFDNSLLVGFGIDAVYFVARVKIRDFLINFPKILQK